MIGSLPYFFVLSASFYIVVAVTEVDVELELADKVKEFGWKNLANKEVHWQCSRAMQTQGRVPHN